jgi:hypothetical protein
MLLPPDKVQNIVISKPTPQKSLQVYYILNKKEGKDIPNLNLCQSSK